MGRPWQYIVMEVLSPGQAIRPRVQLSTLRHLIRNNYGISQATMKQLNGYDDYNFHVVPDSSIDNEHITRVWEFGYVLKIMNSLDSENTEFIEAQHELMFFLDKSGVSVPLPIKNKNGDTFSLENLGGNSGNVVRMLTFKPGKELSSTKPSKEIMYDVGKFVGKLSNCINVFRHPGYTNRQSIWMLENVFSIRSFLYVVTDEHKLKVVTEVLQEFQDKVMANIHLYRKGLIHGDINEHNLLIEDNKVSSLLDFGDSHYSLLVFELAIAICYMLIHSNWLECPKDIIGGYLEQNKLDINERKIIKTCVCARLCQSLVLGLYSHSQDPANEYVLGTQKNGWQLLLTIYKWESQEIKEYWNLHYD